MADPFGGPGTGAFAGVGDNSVAGIQKAATASGLYPKPLQDTNDVDTGAASYHGSGNAVDFSNGDNAGTPEMDQFAAWVGRTYGTVSIEIIHVNQDGTGVYYKYGKQVAASFYSSVLSQHRNHVHWAITNPGLKLVDPSVVQPASAATGDSASTNSQTTQTGSVLAALFGPIVEFFIEAGMVTAGIGLLLFGLVLVFRVDVGKYAGDALKAGAVAAA